ncbi:MAG: ABC transporter permease [Phycisphaerales bacterium]|nr:ABC transporter permease [Phycisphaerales bacterium]
MTAVLAILLDSYRALKAQKLFKTVLGLSVVVILGFASFGFNEQGMTFFFGLLDVESEYIYEGSKWAKTLYLGIFSYFIVSIWLGWAATILALISTSSIFPSFLSEGAVELTMSKPVRRTTMFFTKYLGGLMFVFLQVGLFCVGAFLVVGWRIGEWNATIFLAIPLVTLFFSYLFCVNVFFGVMTRSTLVALLFTVLFWFTTFGIRTADDTLSMVQFRTETLVSMSEKSLEAAEDNLKEYQEELVEIRKQGSDSAKEYYESQLKRGELNLEDEQKSLNERRETLGQLKPWGIVLDVIRWPLPETSRTIGLLTRWVEQDNEVSFDEILSGDWGEEGEGSGDRRPREIATERINELEETVPAFQIIGKSLIFELVILIFAWWIFVRRDY